MKRSIARASVMVLIVLVCAYNGLSQTGKATAPSAPAKRPVAVKTQQVAAKPSTACTATQTATVSPVKAPKDQQRIFDLLDDEQLADAKALVDSDPAIINLADSDGLTPLARMANTENLTVRMSNGSQGTAQSQAAPPRAPLVAEMLLAKGAIVNTRDDHGGTPLIWAVAREKEGLANLLIKNCADVNYTLDILGSQGMTPLHFAAGHGELSVVRMLVAAGAKINARDDRGRSPLYIAARSGWTQIVDVLLRSRADVNAKDNEGRTPLKIVNTEGAKVSTHAAVVALLTKNGGVE